MSLLTRLFKCKRKLYSFKSDYVARPSETILETMEALGITTQDVLSKCALRFEDFPAILDDEIRITKRIATELSKVLGSEPLFWMNLSKNYHDKKGDKDV